MTDRNSLNINRKQYKRILSVLKHDCYTNSFNSSRKQQQNFLEHFPTLSDFTTDVDTLAISLPFPISEPTSIENIVDNCTVLLLEKQQYNDKLNSYVNRYKKDRKWLTKKYVRQTKYGMLPKYVFDLSMKNVKDPDIYFNGNYNWYFTGGVLDTFTILNQENLIYPNNENLLCIRNDIENSNIVNVDLDRTPIFNVRAYDNGTIFSIRQKHKVCLLKIKSRTKKILFNVINSEVSNNIPYIDVKYTNNEMCTLKLNRELQIRDLNKEDTDSHVFEKTDCEPPDSFGQIEYVDQNIIFLDRSSIRMFDKRTMQEEKLYEVKNNFFKCDELCTFTISNNSEYLFASSLHNIFKFDLRQMDVVKTWSHMLSAPPLIMKTSKYYGDELLFLSSQRYDERIVLLSNMDESNLVQRVPNNIDTWNECNRNYNFNLNRENERRLKCSTAGISFIENKRGMALYTCTSLSDIFQNNISRETDSSIRPLENIDNWMKGIPTTPKPLIISHVCELSHIRSSLNEPMNVKNLDRYTTENKKRTDLLSELTLENIDMAAIWLTEDNLSREDLAPSTSSNVKVTEWLKRREENISDNENSDSNRF